VAAYFFNIAVFIHCAAGISRSATVACAFLMRRKRIALSDALAQLRTARPCVSPNDGTLALALYSSMAVGAVVAYSSVAGFELQLQLWHEMQYQTLGSERAHRHHR
jgi:predicted protein tyrosine phosphatase